MKNTVLSLGRVLHRAELKTISGGHGDCAYYNGQTGRVTYGLSGDEAQGLLSDPSDHWCCNSCNSASWYNRRDAFEHDMEHDLEPH